MKILLLQDADEGTRDRVLFSLESKFGAQVVVVVKTEEAIKKIGGPDGPFDLMVCDLSKVSVQEFETFQTQTNKIQTVICHDKNQFREPPVEWNVVALVDRSSLINNLISAIEKLIEKGTLQREQKRADFCRIRTKLLLSVVPLKADIYIRLSDTHYVKLMREGDAFELADLQKYTVKKGVEYLFLRNEETQEFIHKYNNDLQRYLAKSYTLDISEAAKITESIYDTVQEMGKQLGFTKDVQVLAKTQIRMAVKAMGKNPRLEDLLKKLESFNGQYLAAHSTLTGYLACAIASHMEWGSETTFHKLTLAAFLHDITLSDNEMAKFNTIKEARAAGKTMEETDAYKQHPAQAAEIAKKFNEVPPDVDVIILQHHEQPDGSGFPRGLGHAYISPLGAVFAVAHEMAQYSLEKGKAFDVQEFISKVRDKYNSSRHRKVLAAVEEVYRKPGAAPG